MKRKPSNVNPESRATRSKIGKLSSPLREQLNAMLRDGASGAQALEWLNSLDEAKTKGITINAQNLSDWRKGPYSRWLDKCMSDHAPLCENCIKKDCDIAWYKKMLEMVVERFPKPSSSASVRTPPRRTQREQENP